MNKIEKAIEALKMENELMQFDPNTGEDCPIELQNQDNQDLYNANLIAISALEKQIPKKPREHYNWCDLTTDDFRWYCKNCDNNLDETEKHCPNCGQCLDWEVENE